MALEKATFAAGCFWHVEKAFYECEGVIETSVGFMGGDMDSPSYEQVCGGDTGHAEVVHLTFDPEKTSYKQLLEVFWSIHDPTQMNRQGPDVGHQYRSAIFYHNEEQKNQAEESKEHLEASKRFKKPIVTEIVSAKEFYMADDYHQKYFMNDDYKQRYSMH